MALPATPAVRQQMRLDEMPRLDRNSRQIQIWPCYCQSSLQQLQGTGLGALTTASLKRWVPIAVDRAIREIIQPVVERSGALQRKLLQGLCNGERRRQDEEGWSNSWLPILLLCPSSHAGNRCGQVFRHLRQLLTRTHRQVG
jgi:hypothetical protein